MEIIALIILKTKQIIKALKLLPIYDPNMDKSKLNEPCKKISEIEEVGPITATAIVSALTDTKLFKSGREFGDWLGLVPKQHLTGGKQTLLGIHKRGDIYLRTLLVHSTRAVISRSKNKTDRRSEWVNSLRERSEFNKACVALANKNARIILAFLESNQVYRKPV